MPGMRGDGVDARVMVGLLGPVEIGPAGGATQWWSSPIGAFPVSGQPPAVIFCVQSTTRAADRTLQQRLGM